MPTINKKLLLRLFIATIILGGGLFLINYVQSDRITEALRWQSEHAAENGRLDKAIFYMKQYLELRPSDHEAAVKLGDLILSRGSGRNELSSVLFLYERVLREAPQRDDLRRKLVDICLRLNRHGDAGIHARALLDQFPRDGELWEKMAIAQAAQNKNDDARSSYVKAIECDPTRVRSYELLAELLIRQLHQDDEARDWIEKMVRANPANGEAYLVRARYQRSRNKMPECLADIDRLMELDPENADGLLMLSDLMQGKDDINKARTTLTAGVALYPKDVRFYRSLSWLEMSAGNLAAAVACLEQGMTYLPDSTELLTPLADLMVQQGEVERVNDIIKKLQGRSGVETQIVYLRGRVLMQEGKWSEAVKLLEGLRTQAVAMPGLAAQVNLLLASCQERLGNRESQTEALRRVLLIDPGHLGAHLQFGTFQLAAGELDEAVKEYAIAARAPTASLSTRITLGRLMIAHARWTGSSTEWEVVTRYVESVREKYKNTVDPVLLTAELLMARQQFEPAKKLLRHEAGRKVNDPRIWSVLSAVALEADGLHAAIGALDEAQGFVGDQVELRLARARVWAVDWQPGREERIRALGRIADEFSEAEQIRLLMGLADVCSSIRDFEGVKHFQKQVAVRVPRDLPIRRNLFESAVRTRDEALRTQLRREIKNLSDETTLALADALADVNDAAPTDMRIGEWRKLARQVLDATPERSDAHLLMAKLADKAGESAEAMKQYALAVTLEPSNLNCLEAQLAFLLRREDPTVAKKRVEQLYYDPRMPGDAFLGLLDDVFGKLNPEQINRCLSWVEPLVKKSSVSLLWLARIQQGKGRMEQAQSLVGRTATAAPTFVDAWIAQARLQPGTILETLKTAQGVLDPREWFTLCAETLDVIRKQNPDWMPELKKPEDARLYAQACLDTFLLRGKISEATDLLKKLADNPTARPEDATWAKRNLAVLAASRGGPVAGRQAAMTLRDMKADPDSSTDDLRAISASLALASRHLHGMERRALLQQAIVALKRVTACMDATAKDWYHLAQIHRQIGEPAAYQEAIKKAMRLDESNLFYVTVFVDHLLHEGRLKEAEASLSRLLQATFDSRAAGTAAKYFTLANLPARSLEIIEQFAQAADPGTSDGPARTRQAADMLDELARLATAKNLPCAKALMTAAEEKYRAAMRNYPEAAGSLAVLLAFDGRTPAAFTLLASMKSSLSAKVLTISAVAVLRAGAAAPKHYAQVKGWIDAALAENPNSSVLRLNLAEFHALRQEYAAAEPLYRSVLVNEPDNIIALNNLAWILAPRGEASDEALKCVERAIELSGPSGELLDTRARIYIARGNIDRALEDLNQALEYSQTSLRFFHLAIAQFKQLKKDDAVHSFKEARTRGLDPKMIHPNDMPTYKVLAAQILE